MRLDTRVIIAVLLVLGIGAGALSWLSLGSGGEPVAASPIAGDASHRPTRTSAVGIHAPTPRGENESPTESVIDQPAPTTRTLPSASPPADWNDDLRRLDPDAPIVRLTGEVQLPDGAPAPGCTVNFRDVWHGPLSDAVTTDASGRFAYSGPQPTLSDVHITPSAALTALGFLSLTRPNLLASAAEVAADATPPHIIVTLHAGKPGVTWRVAGDPAGPLDVLVRRSDASTENRFAGLSSSALPLSRDGDRWRAEIAPGQWRMAMALPELPPWTTTPFIVRDGEVTDLGRFTPPRDAVLELDLRRADVERCARAAMLLDDARGLLEGFGRSDVVGVAQGAQGLMTFRGLPAGELRVAIRHRNQLNDADVVTIREGATTRLQLMGDAYSRVTVLVLDRNGDPLPDVSVTHGNNRMYRPKLFTEFDSPYAGGGSFGGRSGGWKSQRTDARGIVMFNLRTWTSVEIWCRFPDGTESERVRIGPLEHGDARRVVLQQPAVGAIPVEGVIRDGDTPLVRARVALVHGGVDGTGAIGLSSDTGAFTVGRALPGVILVRWDHDDSWGIVTATWDGVAVADGGTPTTIALPDGSVKITVVDGSGPFPDARIVVRAATGGARTTTGRDGVAELRHLAPGEYQVTIDAVGHPRTETTLAISGGSNGTRTVPINTPGAITIRNVPLGAMIEIRPAAGGGATDPAATVATASATVAMDEMTIGSLPVTRSFVTIVAVGLAPLRVVVTPSTPPALVEFPQIARCAVTFAIAEDDDAIYWVRLREHRDWPMTVDDGATATYASRASAKTLIVARGSLAAFEWRIAVDPSAPWRPLEVQADGESVIVAIPPLD
jgi:hypothetical protein